MAQLAGHEHRELRGLLLRRLHPRLRQDGRGRDARSRSEWSAPTSVRIIGPLDTDLQFSIKGIPAIQCDGDRNIPDGEVFTAPVRDSVNGVIHFNAGTIYQGKLFDDIRLVFKDGKIVEATGSDTKALNEILDTDEGARYVGEFSLGFNPYIKKAMRDILFDEKICGSIHFTPGQAYDEADNGNRSKIHWDMVLIQTEEFGGGEIWFDDELIRKDGRFVPGLPAGAEPGESYIAHNLPPLPFVGEGWGEGRTRSQEQPKCQRSHIPRTSCSARASSAPSPATNSRKSHSRSAASARARSPSAAAATCATGRYSTARPKAITRRTPSSAIYAKKAGGEPVARVLESQLQPSFVVGAGMPPDKVCGLPRLQNATFKGEYPLAWIDFEDNKLPVHVSLEAFNPFIPLNEKDSGLPVAILRYTVKNTDQRQRRLLYRIST